MASVVKNGIFLLAVGFVSSLLGVLITRMLLLIRHMLSHDIKDGRASQQVLGISVAYAVWMATSGNVRYQIVGGLLEDRCFSTMFAKQPTVLGALSFVTRTVNTYVGSAWWVDFLRYLKLQEA